MKPSPSSRPRHRSRGCRVLATPSSRSSLRIRASKPPFIPCPGGSILRVKFLDPLSGLLLSGMILKAGLKLVTKVSLNWWILQSHHSIWILLNQQYCKLMLSSFDLKVREAIASCVTARSFLCSSDLNVFRHTSLPQILRFVVLPFETRVPHFDGESEIWCFMDQIVRFHMCGGECVRT